MAISPKELWQKLKLQLNEPDVNEPEYLPEFYVSNIVNRVLAILQAEDVISGEIVRLKALSDGSLKVATTGTSLVFNETHSGTIAGNTEITIDFTDISSVIDIWSYDGEIEISRSYDGITYQDYITLEPSSFFEIQALTKSIKINNTNTTPITYQIVAWR